MEHKTKVIGSDIVSRSFKTIGDTFNGERNGDLKYISQHEGGNAKTTCNNKGVKDEKK